MTLTRDTPEGRLSFSILNPYAFPQMTNAILFRVYPRFFILFLWRPSSVFDFLITYVWLPRRSRRSLLYNGRVVPFPPGLTTIRFFSKLRPCRPFVAAPVPSPGSRSVHPPFATSVEPLSRPRGRGCIYRRTDQQQVFLVGGSVRARVTLFTKTIPRVVRNLSGRCFQSPS